MKKCPRCGVEYADASTLCPADGAVLQKEDELVGQTLTGKYRIDERISEGGMGAVYKATHVLMEKTVAIKVLHPALAADDKIVARFTREAKAASRISHPHALTVTDFGESENGVVFLVMEYLPGRTLKEVVRAEGPMPLARVAEIVRQVAGALDAAHAVGVVHRDLKSDNIMLDQAAGGGDWSKVLDFGIAKIKEKVDGQDPELTAPNLIIGTPQYMSPEQCSQAANIDARSDIYSLGIIVYEMLAGHVPFAGDSPTETMMKHLQEPPPSILRERADVPASVDRVIQRAMAKRPEDRFQSAGELSEALQLAASDDAAIASATAVAAGATGAVSSPATDGQSAPGTSRIRVPTNENERPYTTGSEEAEEATVVSARRTSSHHATPPPAAASSFNPWRIAVPALAALVAVFGLFYYFQGSDTPASGAGAAPGNTAVAPSGPAGRPVVSTTPPTGESEKDVAPSNTQSQPTPGGDAVAVDPGAPPATSGTPAPDAQGQWEPEDEDADPTPEQPARNTNRAIAPTPPKPADDDVDPATPPRRKAPPAPKPDDPPTTAEPAASAPAPR